MTAAPSMRMVVSLADWDDSRWINLTGVSGHPASSHYTDQTELYVAGEYLPWAYSREAVEEAGEDTLMPGARRLRAEPRGVTVTGDAAAPHPTRHGKPDAYVVGIRRHGQPDLLGVEHHRHRRPGDHPGQGPVVGPAAAPEPVAGTTHGEPRDQHHVGTPDRVDAEPRPGGLEQTRARPAPGSTPRRRRPSPGRCPGSSTGTMTRLPAPSSASRSNPVPGSLPTET